jgi:hypothetical protein
LRAGGRDYLATLAKVRGLLALLGPWRFAFPEVDAARLLTHVD